MEDRAGNISEDFLLNVTVDTTLEQQGAGATLDLATRIGRGVFVTVFADNGTRYLSDEGLFQ